MKQKKTSSRSIPKDGERKNVIKIVHDPGYFFGQDNINIDIKRTSFGALKLLHSDIKGLKNDFIKTQFPGLSLVTNAYLHMLTKLEKALHKQLYTLHEKNFNDKFRPDLNRKK